MPVVYVESMVASLTLWVGCVGGGDGAVPIAEVATGPFEVVVAIPGELEAVRSVTLSAPNLDRQAKIEWVIEEGARVVEGDVVVRFDDSELLDMLDKAQNELQVAETKIEQRRAQLDVKLGDLQNEVSNGELSLKRAEMRVTDSETVPRVERETARLEVQAANITVERNLSALQSGRLEGEAELELLRLDAERARKQVQRAKEALELAELVAPGPGIVILPSIWKGGSRGQVAAGDTVWPGSTLAQLPDLAEMRVEAWVHEVDAAKIAPDQPVTVVLDAHPDERHAGTVAKVADLAVQRDPDRTVKHLQVGVALDETTPVMKPGMTVRAEVRVARLDQALAIPREAVFHGDDGPFVRVRGFTGFAPRPVTLGLSNDTHVVVTEGLAVGDVVALIDPEAANEPRRPGVPGPAGTSPAPAAAATGP